MIDKDLRKKLSAPLPKEAIKRHPSKTFLSTIKQMYVIERLNDVFGVCGWNFEHEIISDTEAEVIVRGRITLPEGKFTPFQYGGHKKGGKGYDPGDAHKSAATDCLTKCASYLEIGIDVFKGNADKTPVSTNGAAQIKPVITKLDATQMEGVMKMYNDGNSLRMIIEKLSNKYTLTTTAQLQIQDAIEKLKTETA